MDNFGTRWRVALAAALGILTGFVVWTLIPLYDATYLIIGFCAPAIAAWVIATFAIRRGFVGHGSYGVAWGIYAVVGTVFWEIVWDCYPLLLFWKPLICEVFQGPGSPCTAVQYLRERSFWMPFGFALLLVPHSALSGLVFIIRSFLPDYRRILSS